MPHNNKKSKYILDKFSQREVRLWEQRFQAIADYYWDHYSYFAHKRSQIYDELKSSLADYCQSFVFSKWQRVVNYQFSLEPLSARGSILNKPGGRFNIGDIDEAKFPRFAALYLAEDRETSYKEKFGLSRKDKHSGLTADELLLTNDSSITIISLRGKINQVLDLNKASSLKDFFNLIKHIKIPASFVKRANKLNISPEYQVKTLNELLNTLLKPDWRMIPMLFDIPANSQIIGQIAFAAGIEGILFPSRMSDKNCLAVFPKNFEKSESFIEIEDAVPNEIKYSRLDMQSYLYNI